MKIAHLSDPHVLNLAGVPRARILLNKRLTGWINLKLHRGSVHRRQIVEAMMDDIRAQRIDHVVVTGDVTNLALEPEFELALEVFARLGFDPEQLSVIPGNHDVYTRGSEHARRFAQFFAKSIRCDLGVADAGNHPSGPFPFVRLRGDAAIIGLSTAVSRLPLIASGRAGERQIRALAEALEHPEVARRTPIVLVHHPLINPPGRTGRILRGLAEAPEIQRVLEAHPRVVVLHGHLHDRARREMVMADGRRVQHIGATSASLLHANPDRVAGYNVYEVLPEGLASVQARVWDAVGNGFVDGEVRLAGPNDVH
jgi:3',5'-cyclic AMP phosphodiesterase CpdA